MSINLLDLPRFSVNPLDYPLTLRKGLCYSRSYQVELAQRLNDNAENIELNMLSIVTSPEHQEITYKDILPWRQRAVYLRSQGQARAAKRLEKAEALREAKQLDNDEEFQAGYQEFLVSEFDIS